MARYYLHVAIQLSLNAELFSIVIQCSSVEIFRFEKLKTIVPFLSRQHGLAELSFILVLGAGCVFPS